MHNPSTALATPVLTRLHLWVMAISTGMVVANLYYNQPLLGKIAADFGITEAKAGSISMLTQVGYAVGMFFIIPLGDMFRRKRLIMADFILIVIALVLAAFAGNIEALMLASFFIGATSVVPQLLIPMAAHLSKPEERGRTVGFVMSGLLIGILLSRTLSGFVGEHLGWRAMFLIGAGLMVALWLALYFLLPEVHPSYKGTYKELMGSLAHLAKEEPLLRLAAIRGALCYACFSAFWTTLVFLLEEPPFNAGSDVAGSFGLIGAFGALAASGMGRLTDKGNAFRITTLTILLIVVSFVIFGVFSGSIIGLVVGVILMDLGVQATHIANQTLIFSLRPEARNRLNTVYMVTYFTGGALGTYLASQAWHFWQWNGVVATGLLCSALALSVHVSFLRRNRVKS
ncbi:putative MFS family arabinose efflux permease [Pontibacter ummariensis]|uniref:Predicted arabinose efflux permease, MFS family n=1 Tax=Pontibacter ummariensis TaxID=1610492 RepID=A0A239BRP8_9BACT|nr:MFS transporter [Pontibacter ummariensis]PRY15682.1 putative MFS family arabinose efflux permease [Pontibacter ummariensis]SNS10091.1 Predicted arabinose efflux permease, MFS family [Pontibacter ummariensis]